eukprot:TRINITY_DN112526_c0_g1_i1.p1 TRINITY_DN112526_c0_g1~~TRINITY_DN112526_c0_g1_i1.p1  ORF type:complete len:310 (-),score=74.09 TRINITY_DN112526_c0_g1_i1:7-936(-)
MELSFSMQGQGLETAFSFNLAESQQLDLLPAVKAFTEACMAQVRHSSSPARAEQLRELKHTLRSLETIERRAKHPNPRTRLPSVPSAKCAESPEHSTEDPGIQHGRDRLVRSKKFTASPEVSEMASWSHKVMSVLNDSDSDSEEGKKYLGRQDGVLRSSQHVLASVLNDAVTWAQESLELFATLKASESDSDAEEPQGEHCAPRAPAEPKGAARRPPRRKNVSSGKADSADKSEGDVAAMETLAKSFSAGSSELPATSAGTPNMSPPEAPREAVSARPPLPNNVTLAILQKYLARAEGGAAIDASESRA